MPHLPTKDKCCGCNVCGDVCAQGAISFEVDADGFLYPKVDRSKCISCGKCLKVCPSLKSADVRSAKSDPLLYCDAAHKNYATLFDSAAGGAFSALANVVFRQGGFVGGAIWGDNYLVRHVLSSQKSDLVRFQGIKYGQSDSRGFYTAARSAVETGKPVLICGTPCQIAAIRLFLGDTTPENLILVDFVCRGAIAPLAWSRYIAESEAQVGSKLSWFKSTDNEYSWDELTVKLVFKNKHVVYDTRKTSTFMKRLLEEDALWRQACAPCSFANGGYASDITLGRGCDNSFVDPCGRPRSLGATRVFVRSEKGAKLWTKASESMAVKEVPHEEMLLSPTNQSLASLIPNRKLALLKRAFKLIIRPGDLFRLIRYNGILPVLKMQPVLAFGPGMRTVFDGKIILKAKFTIGKRFPGVVHRGSSLVVKQDGELIVNGETEIGSGSSVEVLKGGKLIFEGGARVYHGAYISCGCQIRIGRYLKAAKNVTIRDNNGGHWINLPGYKNARPVEIGEHVWLGDGCTIMPGVKIGAGAIVSSHAVVYTNVPPNTMVVGNPAEVVCEGVEWKY